MRGLLIACALLAACAWHRTDTPLATPRLQGYFPDVVPARPQHAGIIVYGNEASGRWAAMPGLPRAQLIADAVLRIADPIGAAAPALLAPACETVRPMMAPIESSEPRPSSAR